MVRGVGRRDKNQALLKTSREKNGLSPAKAAFKCLGIRGHGMEREDLQNVVSFSEFGKLLV